MTNHKGELIPEATLEKKVEMVKALAHPVRLQIVNILMKGDVSAGNILKNLSVNRSLTSQQLSILKLHGILKARRNGNFVYYSIENNGIKNIIATILAQKLL